MSNAYTPHDVAEFLKWADFSISDGISVKNDIWENENISFEYSLNKKKFINAINKELMFMDESSNEIESINAVFKDMGSSYVLKGCDREPRTAETYLKKIRLRLKYDKKTREVRIKLSSILKELGYKRRSQANINGIKCVLKELGIKTYLRGYRECDISEVNRDDMIMLRLDDRYNIKRSRVHNLNKYLNDLLEKYKNAGYCAPHVRWSSEPEIGKASRYSYDANEIVINKIFDNGNVPEVVLKFLIYRELIHQKFLEDDSEFLKLEKKFPNGEKIKSKIKCYMDNYVLPEKLLHNNEKLMFCFIDNEEYKKGFVYYNKYVYCLYDNILFDRDYKNADVIWLIEKGDLFNVVGWSVNTECFKGKQSIKHSSYGGLDINYRIRVKKEDMYLLPDTVDMRKYSVDKFYFNDRFKKTGVSFGDNYNRAFKELVNNLNKYRYGFTDIGICEKQIYNRAPVKTKDVNKIIEMSLNEKDPYRRLWLANTAVSIEEKYETLLNAADALKYATLYDDAVLAYYRAMEYKRSNEAMGGLIKSLVMLGEFEEVRRICNEGIDDSYIKSDRELFIAVKRVL